MPRRAERRRFRNTLVGVLAVWLRLLTMGVALLAGTGIAFWPQAGAVTGGITPLLKRVLALPGDWVDVSPDGLRVNGRKIEHSPRLVADHAGQPRPPPPALGAVPAGYVWLLRNPKD